MQQALETERLILKAITPEVYDDLFSRNNSEEIKHVLGLLDDDELAKYRENYAKGMSCFSMTFVYFTINLKAEPNKVIGTCGYYRIYPQHDRGEVGYTLFSDEVKRQGIVSEALAAVLDYGFNTMNFHRIEAIVGKDNVASLRMMDKFNFTKEGHMKEHYLKNGKYEDSIVFGLLKANSLT